MIRNFVWWRCPMSEAEHVVEAEGAVAPDQAMIAEKSTGRVAHDDIGRIAGACTHCGREDLVITEKLRSRTRNGDALTCDFFPGAIVEDQIGRALGMPGGGGGIDQMAERVMRL